MDYFAELDRLIEGPVYVIDYLPGPVPASRGRHYWKGGEMVLLPAGIQAAVPQIPALPAQTELLL